MRIIYLIPLLLLCGCGKLPDIGQRIDIEPPQPITVPVKIELSVDRTDTTIERHITEPGEQCVCRDCRPCRCDGTHQASITQADIDRSIAKALAAIEASRIRPAERASVTEPDNPSEPGQAPVQRVSGSAVSVDAYGRQSWQDSSGQTWFITDGSRFTEGQTTANGRFRMQGGRVIDLQGTTQSTRSVRYECRDGVCRPIFDR